jgi:hypothetical protein
MKPPADNAEYVFYHIIGRKITALENWLMRFRLPIWIGSKPALRPVFCSLLFSYF